MSKLLINTDGGSRGNPGPAGIGVVFYDENEKEIHSYNKFIGSGTNNEAEYSAIIEALKLAKRSDWFNQNNGSRGEIICRLDSQLVVEQINGRYKVKQLHIQIFIDEIRELLREFDLKISFIHIRREQNKRADQLVNKALDEELKRD
jgi:ribonuclease HI